MKLVLCVRQGLPFHSTVVQSEYTQIAYAIFFFMLTLKNYCVKKTFFFKSKVIYVLKTHFHCFNSQVNNSDDMEREQY